LVDWWTDPTHTEPLAAALMAGEFLAHVGGDVYSEEEMNSWLAETGWRPLEKLPLAGPISTIVAKAVGRCRRRASPRRASASASG
jgi:hypothetical protein